MSEIYWFKSGTIQFDKLSDSNLAKALPIPLKAISEFHFLVNSPAKITTELPVRNWKVEDNSLDLFILLLNRLKATATEAFLLLSNTSTEIQWSLFGSGALVGRFNLPPEFEIQENGWVKTETLKTWVTQSDVLPKFVSLAENEDTKMPMDYACTSFPQIFSETKEADNKFIVYKAEAAMSTFLMLERV